MKICVIGGAGYIGSHVVLELIKKGNKVIVIDNLSTGLKEMVHKDAIFYNADITKKETIIKVFEKEKDIDVVMHLAAKLIVPESVKEPLKYYYNNVEGLRILLETMVDFNIKNIIFSSTAAVYGSLNKDILEETDPTCPINPYGETKIACEKMLKWVAEVHPINFCIFRYFNVAGADKSLKIGLKKDNLTHIIPVTIQTALGQRSEMTIFGDQYNTPDGTCIRDYIHVSDIASAHLLAAKYLLEKKESLLCNLGSNNGYSVKEIIHEVEKIKPVNYKMGTKRDGDSAITTASNKLAKAKLGWVPKYSLEEIIKTDMEFRIKQQQKTKNI